MWCVTETNVLFSERIDWFIEDQAFFRSYDSAPRPPHSPPSPARKLPLFVSLPVCRMPTLLRGGGGGGAGVEPNHTISRKLGPLSIMQYSLAILLASLLICLSVYVDVPYLTFSNVALKRVFAVNVRVCRWRYMLRLRFVKVSLLALLFSQYYPYS